MRSVQEWRKAYAFLERPVADFTAATGVMVTNPPYGQRLADINSARAAYRDMAFSVRPLLNEFEIGRYNARWGNLSVYSESAR